MTAAEIPSDDAIAARQLTDRIKVAVEGTWQLITEAYTSRAWAALGYTNWDDYCTREFGTSRLRLPREERSEVVASLRESGLSIRAIEAATGVSRPTIIKDLRPAQVVNSLPPDPQTPPSTIPQGEPVSRAVDGGSTEPVLTQEDCEDLDDEATDRLAERISAELAASDRGYLGRAQQAVLDALPPVSDEPAPRITGTDGKSYPAPKPAEKARREPLPKSVERAMSDLRKRAESLAKTVADDRFTANRPTITTQQWAWAIESLKNVTAFIEALDPAVVTETEKARQWWLTSLSEPAEALHRLISTLQEEK